MNFDRNAKSPAEGRPGAPASTASVPISLYRELAAELQATQAMLDSLHSQNQQLCKQNLHLQQEVDSIVQVAQQMQHHGDGNPPAGRPMPAPPQQPESSARPMPQPRRARPANPPHSHPLQGRSPQRFHGQPQGHARRQLEGQPGAIETLNKIFTGREQPLPRQALGRDRGEEISTWWLVAVVLLIVVTAFGTGFMLVRPLLAPSR